MVDLASPTTLMMLVPDELRIAGRFESTPTEVCRAIAEELYDAADYTIVADDDPAVANAAKFARVQIGMVGGGLADDDLGPATLRFTINDRVFIRHVFLISVRAGAVPKKSFVNFAKPEEHGLMRVG